MKLELELWQVIILGSMIIGAFWGLARMLMRRWRAARRRKCSALQTVREMLTIQRGGGKAEE